MNDRIMVSRGLVLIVVSSLVAVAAMAQTRPAGSNEVTEFNDWYEGGPGIDQAELLAGDDVFIGKGGADTASGGAGNDMLDGGPGDDLLEGGEGNDRLFGAAGDDRLLGGSGDDLLAGGDGNDSLAGGDGIDSMRGGDGDDHIEGGDGDDFIRGDRGGDRLQGGPGADTYVFQFEDDLPFESQSRTEVIDGPGEGNQVIFIGGMGVEDVVMIRESGVADLEIQYGYAEVPRKSRLFVLNGADGEVVSIFRFSDGETLSFEQLCQANPDTCR
ncbi:calcium-binding protein [Wenzhouxiangella marina]|uniref:Uncharacterized protein n=1 Tax=Wenzhouxiangella marina TaxID=1579979 RepID=A0A0K0XZ26_9GAMM|nr:calcium-binding protein [Wenzhouxiangella marina]AKS42925.1 hypothetical protein WM2015_2567 [Wenzhouxiangella marina]MBB6087392.1 Ca2+-binding RTX toxin-like protein [Wenzhouxiangella marina]